eukprot:3312659-Pyramimonas_sp.AAC.1
MCIRDRKRCARSHSPPLPRLVYTPSPPAIGSHAGYILPPLLRLVVTLGIYRLRCIEAGVYWAAGERGGASGGGGLML